MVKAATRIHSVQPLSSFPDDAGRCEGVCYRGGLRGKRQCTGHVGPGSTFGRRRRTAPGAMSNAQSGGNVQRGPCHHRRRQAQPQNGTDNCRLRPAHTMLQAWRQVYMVRWFSRRECHCGVICNGRVIAIIVGAGLQRPARRTSKLLVKRGGGKSGSGRQRWPWPGNGCLRSIRF
jgi:hypothetical protein